MGEPGQPNDRQDMPADHPAGTGYGAPDYPPPPGYGYPPPGYGYPPPYGYGPPPGYGPPGYGPPPGNGPPPGHLGWAIVAVLLFWPLAIPAFINYGKVESCFYRGDVAGAIRASASVKKFGVIAMCIGIAFVVLWIILFVAVFATVHTHCVGC
jgi:hypothetical protein